MAVAMIQPKESCVCVTPFGLPVLPEVKKMNAGVAGSGGGRSAAGASDIVISSSRGSRPSSAAKLIRPSGSWEASSLFARSSLRSVWAISTDAPLTSRA